MKKIFITLNSNFFHQNKDIIYKLVIKITTKIIILLIISVIIIYLVVTKIHLEA